MAKSRNSPLCKVGDLLSVDAGTGEAVPVEGGGLRMLPGPPGACEWCHVRHAPAQPHNQQSLSYRVKFNAVKGRYPTWTDAMAHCDDETKRLWRRELVKAHKANGLPVPADLLDTPEE